MLIITVLTHFPPLQIHIIPDSIKDFQLLLEYPIGGITATAGLMSLVVLDYVLTYYLTPDTYKQQIRTALEHNKPGATDIAVKDPEGGGMPPAGIISHQHVHAFNHHHAPSGDISTVRQYITSYTMELGCIFHSVIIGINIGVLTDAQLLITFLVVMAFHQALEGLALGSILAITKFSKVKKVTMVIVYALTTPIGILIGILIASTYDPESTTSLAVQAVFNGVSGGMLLYVAMYQLIGEEFTKQDLLVRPKLGVALFAALSVGLAFMCIIGIWG